MDKAQLVSVCLTFFAAGAYCGALAMRRVWRPRLRRLVARVEARPRSKAKRRGYTPGPPR